MSIYLKTFMVMYISSIMGMLYRNTIFVRDGYEHPTSFVETSQKGEAQRAEQ